MIEEFILRALLGGIGIALLAGPLGCFIVWNRMAYFGDSLAHSALLGVALGLLLGINITLGVVATCLGLATLIILFQRQNLLATDTLLGIISHAALAFGLIALSFMESVRVDLMGYLFGDILTITREDILLIYSAGTAAVLLLTFLWRKLLSITIHEELAHAEGVPVLLTRIALMLLIAFVIAIAMRIIGILLITSLLILPAATARRFARTPEHMAIFASIIGTIDVTAGILVSLQWDIPSGPAIVAAAAIIFAGVSLIPTRR